jgi:hypothetical protein
MLHNWWMDWENWVYIHNGVLFSHKGELNYVVGRLMDGTGEHHTHIFIYNERKQDWISESVWQDFGGGDGKKMVREWKILKPPIYIWMYYNVL